MVTRITTEHGTVHIWDRTEQTITRHPGSPNRLPGDNVTLRVARVPPEPEVGFCWAFWVYYDDHDRPMFRVTSLVTKVEEDE